MKRNTTMELDYRDIDQRIRLARQLRDEALAQLLRAGWQWCKQQLVELHVLHPVAHPS